MRPATFLAALGIFLGAVSAAPQLDSTISVDVNVSPACFSEMDCGPLSFNTPEVIAPTPVVERELTNAARLARGLPLKAPGRRFTPSRVHRSTTSPGPTVRGYIRVDKADGTGNLGYLSAHPFSGAQHRYQDISNAMIVNFPAVLGTDTETQIDIATENSDIQGTFPRLSIVQGRDNTDSNFASGSYQYGYIAGGDLTAPGSTPQEVSNSYTSATGTTRTTESAVWSYNPLNQQIAPQWFNSDGNAVNTVLFTQSTALYVGGDSGSFASRYPSPVVNIVFVFEPLGV